jgi:hypothetical protein
MSADEKPNIEDQDIFGGKPKAAPGVVGRKTRLGKIEQATILNALQMQAEIQRDGGDRAEGRRAQALLDKLVLAADWGADE